MLKRIMRVVRRELLKVEWIKREVEAYKLEQQKRRLEQKMQRHHERLAQQMHSSGAVRPEKLDTSKVLHIVEDNGLFVDYLGGQVVGQGYVNPLFIDSTNWGMK